jgi:hypothetical protein
MQCPKRSLRRGARMYSDASPSEGEGERRVLLPVGGVTPLGVAASPTREQTNPSPPPSSPWRPCEMFLIGFREGPRRSSMAVHRFHSPLIPLLGEACEEASEVGCDSLAASKHLTRRADSIVEATRLPSVPLLSPHTRQWNVYAVCRAHYRLAATISQTLSNSKPAP